MSVESSTGSIGTQTLDVISQHPDRLQLVGLAANANQEKLVEQAEKYKVKHTALYKDGLDGIIRLATMEDADIVVTDHVTFGQEFFSAGAEHRAAQDASRGILYVNRFCSHWWPPVLARGLSSGW